MNLDIFFFCSLTCKWNSFVFVCVCVGVITIYILKMAMKTIMDYIWKKNENRNNRKKNFHTIKKKKPNLHLEEPEYTTEYQNQIFFRFFFYFWLDLEWMQKKKKKIFVLLYFIHTKKMYIHRIVVVYDEQWLYYLTSNLYYFQNNNNNIITLPRTNSGCSCIIHEYIKKKIKYPNQNVKHS